MVWARSIFGPVQRSVGHFAPLLVLVAAEPSQFLTATAPLPGWKVRLPVLGRPPSPELLNSPPVEKSDENLKTGKELYEIYCSVCHGSKGDGQGILMKREKFLGIPSYADRDITEGSIYHVLMYGRNLMGSHASLVNQEERWQISQYVLELRNELIK